MTDAKPQLPSYADPLGETLHMLKLNGTLYCRSELTAPWGIDLPPIEGCMMFHIVTAGRGWLEVEGEDPVLLETGSLTLVPHGAGHIIRSSPDSRAEPLFDIPVDRISDRYEVMRHGGGGEYTHSICVVVRFDHVAAERLVALLPKVVQVDAWDTDAESWLQSTLRFIAREAKELRPGGETVITHLSDILVIQAIRSWLATAPAADQGWLAALRDGQIGRALAMIHRTPDRDWSVESLAREVGMSRSAFSARFTELVGQPAMRYITQWRMQLARSQILEEAVPPGVLAQQLGYRSEAAFSRAFKRMFGVSPGRMRRVEACIPGQLVAAD
ncbi:AraC family transcriptional regulator [Nitratireductor sp. XY-223]|uniref:AraC family transcriptional regulator n=1 Tax=Nitratireductor sp. XY-223 TaxID=2561926 RepID=UPI0010AAC236|nr:AraC family transcriptional regulator [Nitratireductor sp. XY-223]